MKLPGWDYSRPAAYFVTMVTKDRKKYFGEIFNGKLILTQLGSAAYEEWFKTPDLRPEMNIELNEFIVMPDHIHGIIWIGNGRYDNSIIEYKNQFGPQRNNLASIIRGYKSSVTMFARKNALEFNWQSGYYDQVIRDDRHYENVACYIRENPLKY